MVAQITPLPTPPTRQDPVNFSARGDAFLGALPQFQVEANALAGEVNSKQQQATAAATFSSEEATRSFTEANRSFTEANRSFTEANRAESEANRSFTEANRAESEANASAASAAASYASATASENYATASANSAAIAISEANRAQAAADSISSGPVTSVNSKTGVVTLLPEDIAPLATQAEAESGLVADVRMFSPLRLSQAINALAPKELILSQRTSNVQLTSADNGKFIDITSGTFTQTFAACSTLGNGWFCYIRNSGTGDITLDPNASEQIDGLTSYIMYPGEVRLVQCDGGALRSVVLNSFYKVFTASGSFTKPPGYQSFGVLMWSGGSSGQKVPSSTYARGGAGGGCGKYQIRSSNVPASVTVIIGAGGLGSTSYSGNVGGNTSFGSVVTVYAGLDWSYGGSPIQGATQLRNSNGWANYPIVGYEGGDSSTTNAFSRMTMWGGSACSNQPMSATMGTVYGGGGGGGCNNANVSYAGGTSFFGGAGGRGETNENTTFKNGSAPGGGGGGVSSDGAYMSGAGARGELRVWGII